MKKKDYCQSISFSLASIKILTFAVILSAMYALEVNANPMVIWDQSPDQIGGILTGGMWSNDAFDQNFSDPVLFENDTTISGMDIYMGIELGNLGDTAVIRIRYGSHLGELTELVGTVTMSDTEGTATQTSLHRLHVDFTNSIILLGGVVYWVGMSPSSCAWTQAGITNGVGPLLDNQSARYAGVDFDAFASDVGDTAFRLWGQKTCSSFYVIPNQSGSAAVICL